MKKFRIVTVCDCWTNYTVEAETLEEAKEKYFEDNLSAEEVDFRNETIIDSDCEELEEA